MQELNKRITFAASIDQQQLNIGPFYISEVRKVLSASASIRIFVNINMYQDMASVCKSPMK